MNNDKHSAEIMIERLILMGQRGAIRKMQESIHCTVGVQEDINFNAMSTSACMNLNETISDPGCPDG
jgi:hypothetical protein